MSVKKELPKKPWNFCHFIEDKTHSATTKSNYDLPVLGYTKKTKAAVVSADLTLLEDLQHQKTKTPKEKQIVLKKDAAGNFMLVDGTLVEVTPIKGSVLASKKITPVVTYKRTNKLNCLPKQVNLQLTKVVKEKNMEVMKTAREKYVKTIFDKSPPAVLVKEFDFKVAKNVQLKEKANITNIKTQTLNDKNSINIPIFSLTNNMAPGVQVDSAKKQTPSNRNSTDTAAVSLANNNGSDVIELQPQMDLSKSTENLHVHITGKSKVTECARPEQSANRRKSAGDIKPPLISMQSGGIPVKQQNKILEIIKTNSPVVRNSEALKIVASLQNNASNVFVSKTKCDATTLTDITLKDLESIGKSFCDAETLTDAQQVEEVSCKKLCDASTLTDDCLFKTDNARVDKVHIPSEEPRIEYVEVDIFENSDWEAILNTDHPIIGDNVNMGVQGRAASAAGLVSEKEDKFLRDVINCTVYSVNGSL